jgi:S1-C subfamily serine protease
VEIELVRGNERMTVDATIGSAPSPETAATGGGAAAGNVLAGAQLSDIPRDDPAYGQVSGALVTQVEQGSRAFAGGLQAGDIITAVNRRPVSSAAEVQAAIEQNSGALALNVVRNGNEQFLIMR